MTAQHPAGYSRAAGIALVVAAVAGAASRDEPRDADGYAHCDCCGHRYVGDHVPGGLCPCDSRAAWDGAM